MSTLKDKLDALNPEQRKQLMYAFENNFEQYIKLPDNKFIGVNVDSVKHLIIEQVAGKWAYGTIKGGTK